MNQIDKEILELRVKSGALTKKLIGEIKDYVKKYGKTKRIGLDCITYIEFDKSLDEASCIPSLLVRTGRIDDLYEYRTIESIYYDDEMRMYFNAGNRTNTIHRLDVFDLMLLYEFLDEIDPENGNENFVFKDGRFSINPD